MLQDRLMGKEYYIFLWVKKFFHHGKEIFSSLLLQNSNIFINEDINADLDSLINVCEEYPSYNGGLRDISVREIFIDSHWQYNGYDLSALKTNKYVQYLYCT